MRRAHARTHVAISDWSVAHYPWRAASFVGASLLQYTTPSSLGSKLHICAVQHEPFTTLFQACRRGCRNQRSFLTGTRDNDFTRSSASGSTPRSAHAPRLGSARRAQLHASSPVCHSATSDH